MALYLLDEILSRQLPLSSGLFAVALICLALVQKRHLLSHAIKRTLNMVPRELEDPHHK